MQKPSICLISKTMKILNYKNLMLQVAPHNEPPPQLYGGYPGQLAHYPYPTSDMYAGWPRPPQYPYPYGNTYLPHYQTQMAPLQGQMGPAQNTNYYPSFQTRLQAMANYNITKDNPQVCSLYKKIYKQNL